MVPVVQPEVARRAAPVLVEAGPARQAVLLRALASIRLPQDRSIQIRRPACPIAPLTRMIPITRTVPIIRRVIQDRPVPARGSATPALISGATGQAAGISASAAMDEPIIDVLARKFAREDILLVLDGAPNHRCGDLVVPANITLLYLPPYSPELNPKENLWDEIREKIFKNYALALAKSGASTQTKSPGLVGLGTGPGPLVKRRAHTTQYLRRGMSGSAVDLGGLRAEEHRTKEAEV